MSCWTAKRDNWPKCGPGAKKNAQIIDWLVTARVNASSTELDAYWQHLAEQQAKQKHNGSRNGPTPSGKRKY